MDYVRVKAYAKINLSLDITGVSGGYHNLDSVVTTVDVYDLITIKKRKKDKLVSISMHGMGSEGIPFKNNNAVKAAEKFIAEFDACGADVTIYKNIPMGAGLGGSSADVAGVLNGLKKLHGIEDDKKIKDIADSLGSDTGYMLTGGYARISGRGEIVKPIESDLKLNLLLLVPKTPVSTPECYRAYDGINCRRPATSDKAEAAVLSGDLQTLGKSLSNALMPAAAHLNADVMRAAEELHEFSPLGVTMTGSGSCVFALFENDQFCAYAYSRYRGKFTAIITKTYLPVREKENG
ncbi:MAG: 4-(cytidine 5'-diphospho)-2-C-methyl-D-erythritol kinase [Candidatus Coproplasma sp.]